MTINTCATARKGNEMKLSDKAYDILKWITLIVIPALATAYVGLSAIWGFPYADEIARTACVVCTLLGALLGISTAEYNKSKEQPFVWHDKEIDE